MKRRDVVYALRANDDLDWIYDVISKRAGFAIVIGYVERLRGFCERLEYGSERGHRRDDIRPGLRIVGFERRVTVAFAVDESRVTILRLFYGGQDWERAFGQRAG